MNISFSQIIIILLLLLLFFSDISKIINIVLDNITRLKTSIKKSLNNKK